MCCVNRHTPQSVAQEEVLHRRVVRLHSEEVIPLNNAMIGRECRNRGDAYVQICGRGVVEDAAAPDVGQVHEVANSTTLLKDAPALTLFDVKDQLLYLSDILRMHGGVPHTPQSSAQEEVLHRCVLGLLSEQVIPDDVVASDQHLQIAAADDAMEMLLNTLRVVAPTSVVYWNCQRKLASHLRAIVPVIIRKLREEEDFGTLRGNRRATVVRFEELSESESPSCDEDAIRLAMGSSSKRTRGSDAAPQPRRTFIRTAFAGTVLFVIYGYLIFAPRFGC
jgi:hypothetical protein